MFEKEMQDFLEKLRTRREFLKTSGKGVVGITVAASVLNMMGCAVEDPGDASVSVTDRGLLISQRNRCVGCQRCEMVCTVFNDGKIHPLISRVKISRAFYYGTEMQSDYRAADGYFGNFLMTPETCRQCEDAPCAAACPVDAISMHEVFGAWVVDKDKCVGCGACVRACPWNMPTIDPEINKSTKCILCGQCAHNCITGALKVVPWEKLDAMLRKYNYSLA